MSRKKKYNIKRQPIWWTINLYVPIRKRWWHLLKTDRDFEVFARSPDSAEKMFLAKWPKEKHAPHADNYILSIGPK